MFNFFNKNKKLINDICISSMHEIYDKSSFDETIMFYRISGTINGKFFNYVVKFTKSYGYGNFIFYDESTETVLELDFNTHNILSDAIRNEYYKQQSAKYKKQYQTIMKREFKKVLQQVGK